MRLERTSSGVAKAGLATGITGASLGILNMLGGANILGGLGARAVREDMYHPCCSEDRLVDRYTLELEAKIAQKDTQIALRDANTFTDQKQLEMYKYVDGRLRIIEQQLCDQEVKNQKTADSFQMVTERMQCCCDSLNGKIEREASERRCADNSIVNYVNATFYPKQIANVSTENETTPQVLYNPLPAQDCCK